MPMAAIIVTDDSFTIVAPDGTDTVLLDEVSAIVAYKLDEITTDLVCCDIVTDSDGVEYIRTVHEEIPGFDALLARFEIIAGFNPKWCDPVILPPFARNPTVIHKRASNAT